MFVTLLIMLFASATSQNYFETGNFVDFSLLSYTFAGMDKVAIIWSAVFFSTVLSYGYRYIVNKLPRVVIYLAYATHQVLIYLFPTLFTLGWRLPPASALMVMCETARLSMKLHSFFHFQVVEAPALQRLASSKKLDAKTSPTSVARERSLHHRRLCRAAGRQSTAAVCMEWRPFETDSLALPLLPLYSDATVSSRVSAYSTYQVDPGSQVPT